MNRADVVAAITELENANPTSIYARHALVSAKTDLAAYDNTPVWHTTEHARINLRNALQWARSGLRRAHEDDRIWPIT